MAKANNNNMKARRIIIVTIICIIAIISIVIVTITKQKAEEKLQWSAILVSNHDSPNSEIVKQCRENGIDCTNYKDLCTMLTKRGYLIYIPTFEYEGQMMGGEYCLPDTILAGLYNEAHQQ